MMDLRDNIKALLDKDCLDNLNGKCDKGLMYHGNVDEPLDLKTFILCWLCHKNDNLAKEITDAVLMDNKYTSKPRRV